MLRSFVETGNFPVDFAVLIPFLDIIPLIPVSFTFADANLDLNPAIFPIHPQRNQGNALFLNLAKQLINLAPVHQQLAWTGRLVLEKATGMVVRTDVTVIEPKLASIDPGKRLGHVRLTGTNRFYFSAAQDHPAFIGIGDVVISFGLLICRDIAHLRKRQGNPKPQN